MLKGWTMLQDSCPANPSVPLMGEPRTGRKFSVTLGMFVDEIEIRVEKPLAEKNTADREANPAQEDAGSEYEEPTEEELNMLRSQYTESSQAPPPSSGESFADYSERLAERANSSRSDWPISAARVQISAPPLRAPPAAAEPACRNEIRVTPQHTSLSSPVTGVTSRGASTLESIASLDAAAAELARQMSTSAKQLALSPAPPPLALLECMSICAVAMQKVEVARRALSA